MKKFIKEHIVISLKGMAMGAADVIPGVSGGTIAFISGIYDKLVSSIANVDLEAFKLLFTGKWKKLVEKINGFFLMALAAGILTSVLLFANLVKFLLENYAEAVWAFFFGLVIASAVIVAAKIKKWKIQNIIGLFAGTVFAFWLTMASLIQTPHTIPYVFGAGVISIIAMILPGISGSFILVILDKYKFIIDIVSGIGAGLKSILTGVFSGNMNEVSYAWNEMQIATLLIFWLGTLIGILGFARILQWLLNKHHDLTISLLIGFMVGSLNKVWPWKETIEWYQDPHGKLQPLLQKNIFPAELNAYLFLCILLAVAGYFAVYFLEKFSNHKKNNIVV